MAEKNINLSREAMQYEHVLIAKDSGRAGMTKILYCTPVNNRMVDDKALVKHTTPT